MFPVYQRGVVVFMIKVFPASERGKWSATGGRGYADEYESMVKTDGDFIALVNTEERKMQFKSLQSNSSNSFSNLTISDTKTSAIIPNEINSIIQANAQNSIDGIGFSTDEPNHKEIRMDWCLVLQNDRNGNLVGLCWAASAATIIRQQTGNRTIEAPDIADEMGIGYNSGGSIVDARTAMINHGCTTQYQAISRQAVNFYEIENCINNQYPIYMNCGSQSNPDEGHAVTMTGYNLNTSSLQYYDSAMNEFEWVGFADGSSATIYSLGEYYTWNASVMIPIY